MSAHLRLSIFRNRDSKSQETFVLTSQELPIECFKVSEAAVDYIVSEVKPAVHELAPSDKVGLGPEQ
jgi:hypothetical protein